MVHQVQQFAVFGRDQDCQGVDDLSGGTFAGRVQRRVFVVKDRRPVVDNGLPDGAGAVRPHACLRVDYYAHIITSQNSTKTVSPLSLVAVMVPVMALVSVSSPAISTVASAIFSTPMAAFR